MPMSIRPLRWMAAATAVALAGMAIAAAPAQAAPGIATIGPTPSSNHDGVRCIQITLNRGIGTTLVVDGQYGQATYNAVRRFQGIYGLSVDGAVGPNTGHLIVAMANSLSITVNGVSCWNYVPTN